ncbi:MAG: metallophosphoesterase [Candidatus Cybelea sp.]
MRKTLLMGFASARVAALAFCTLLIASTGSVEPASREHMQIWLAISDIHLDPFDRVSRASPSGSDTNLALFRSALAQMKRAAPDPSVVLLPGDFFEHHFAARVRESDAVDRPDQAGDRTMQEIAAAFGRTFPRAEFAIALGNNDAPCGDYRSADGSGYLARVARIWTPLVDRHNAAPHFAASFARDGYYAIDSPDRGLRLVVLNTLLFSQQYRGNCGGSEGGALEQLKWLRATLRDSPAGTRNVIMMHIPPGFDPFSTQFVHGFLAWPFLKPRYNEALLNALSANSDRVAYAIAGHAHRFDFRLAGNVPIVVLGSLSPIFRNNPAFYILHVSSDGSLRDIDAHVFSEPLQRWLPKRSFDATWGITTIDGASLTQIHTRLGLDPAMRRAWGAQANGWPPTNAVSDGAWGTRWWRVQWCAQSSLTAHYAECADIQGRIRILVVLTASVIATAIAILVLFAVRRKTRAPG